MFYKKPLKIDIEKIIKGSVILIDKPKNWTSFDLIKKLRYIIKDNIREYKNIKSENLINIPKKIKLGHAGTLDPMATGLLIVCSGIETKNIIEYQSLKKEYEGEITIGKTTPSYDSETPFDSESDYKGISEKEIYEISQKFIGTIDQVPPIYSAIKIKGKRLYKEAREGNKPEVPSRKVFIESFEILKIKLPNISFRISCSKGTYIRSIAHDFGKTLGVGAYLSKLTRTKIGSYKIEDAYDINYIKNYFDQIYI